MKLGPARSRMIMNATTRARTAAIQISLEILHVVDAHHHAQGKIKWRPRPVCGVIHKPQSVTLDLQAHAKVAITKTLVANSPLMSSIYAHSGYHSNIHI